MFYKKSALKNFAKLRGKHLCQSLESSRLEVCNFIKIETLRTAYFKRTPPVIASENMFTSWKLFKRASFEWHFCSCKFFLKKSHKRWHRPLFHLIRKFNIFEIFAWLIKNWVYIVIFRKRECLNSLEVLASNLFKFGYWIYMCMFLKLGMEKIS